MSASIQICFSVLGSCRWLASACATSSSTTTSNLRRQSGCITVSIVRNNSFLCFFVSRFLSRLCMLSNSFSFVCTIASESIRTAGRRCSRRTSASIVGIDNRTVMRRSRARSPISVLFTIVCSTVNNNIFFAPKSHFMLFLACRFNYCCVESGSVSRFDVAAVISRFAPTLRFEPPVNYLPLSFIFLKNSTVLSVRFSFRFAFVLSCLSLCTSRCFLFRLCVVSLCCRIANTCIDTRIGLRCLPSIESST